jgi:DNA polymerase III epsilon subunit-like protein
MVGGWRSFRKTPEGNGKMTVIWCDTETTGLDPIDSGAFEIAFLVFRDGLYLAEKLFHLNPLNDVIKFGEEAYKVNGVPEKTIKSYPAAETVIPEIVSYLGNFQESGGMVFAGYCCGFDYKHVKALLNRYEYSMESLFNGRMIDVYEYVKKSYGRGIIKATPDKKLETICKALGVPHDEAHTALSDIWATRKLYETIYVMGRKGQ